MKSSDFLLQKYHPCVNARRLSHSAAKSVGGLTRGVSRKKSLKVSDSHRNDVSPLTQGLRYRAACEKLISLQHRVRATKSHIQNRERATFKVNGKPPILGSRSPLTP